MRRELQALLLAFGAASASVTHLPEAYSVPPDSSVVWDCGNTVVAAGTVIVPQTATLTICKGANVTVGASIAIYGALNVGSSSADCTTSETSSARECQNALSEMQNTAWIHATAVDDSAVHIVGHQGSVVNIDSLALSGIRGPALRMGGGVANVNNSFIHGSIETGGGGISCDGNCNIL